jgi:hypothetical protein
MFIRNVGCNSTNYTASYPRRCILFGFKPWFENSLPRGPAEYVSFESYSPKNGKNANFRKEAVLRNKAKAKNNFKDRAGPSSQALKLYQILSLSLKLTGEECSTSLLNLS